MRPANLDLAWRSAVVLFAAFYWFGTEALSAFPVESHQTVIKVSTVVVNVYVVVEDSHGRRVTTLNKEDFVLTEDKVPQEIRYFARNSDAPLTLGIAIDTSPSQESVLPAEQKQAKELIWRLLRSGDEAFILRFDDRAELLQDLTSDQQSLDRALERAVPSPIPQQELTSRVSAHESSKVLAGTRFYDAVTLVSNKLLTSPVGRKVIVLLTDGEDQGSRVNLNAAIESAERANLIIYSVAMMDDLFYVIRGMAPHGQNVLNRFSSITGGRTIHIGKPDVNALKLAIEDISEEVRGQYSLGYTPERQHPRSFHNIRVTVRNSHYRVRARRGYYEQP